MDARFYFNKVTCCHFGAGLHAVNANVAVGAGLRFQASFYRAVRVDKSSATDIAMCPDGCRLGDAGAGVCIGFDTRDTNRNTCTGIGLGIDRHCGGDGGVAALDGDCCAVVGADTYRYSCRCARRPDVCVSLGFGTNADLLCHGNSVAQVHCLGDTRFRMGPRACTRSRWAYIGTSLCARTCTGCLRDRDTVAQVSRVRYAGFYTHSGGRGVGACRRRRNTNMRIRTN